MTPVPSSDYDPRARPKPFTFYPPKTSPFWVALAKRRIRRVIRRQLKVTEIDISAADLDTLRRLKGQRCLLTPSHSGGYEPHIILYLSKLLDDIFNYVAAVEVFEQAPINRWLMPRLGVYSIVRGAVDRQSFATTRELLAAGKRWLVIFPEGHTIGQNSTLAPFQEGVIQLAFKAYEDARADGRRRAPLLRSDRDQIPLPHRHARRDRPVAGSPGRGPLHFENCRHPHPATPAYVRSQKPFWSQTKRHIK